MTHRRKRTSLNSVVHSIEHGVGSITKPVTHIVNKEINGVTKLGSEAIGAVGGLGKDLMLPLLIVGGVALVYVISQQK